MFTEPIHNIRLLNIYPGSRVLDVGAGCGDYTQLAGELVGNEGRVYALDIQRPLLEKVTARAREARLRNVHVIWADIEQPLSSRLSNRSVHAAIVSNVLFQVENKRALFDEVARVLVPRGKLLLIDWADSFGGIGPHADHVVSLDDVEALGEASGFVIRKRFETGDFHYGIVAERL